MAPRRALARDSEGAGVSLSASRGARESRVINSRRPGLQIVHPYDFRRPSRFSKDHQRTLQQIHEQFARGYATALSSFLRLNVRAQLTSVDQTAFEDYADSLPNPTVLYVLRIPELDGPVTVELAVDPTRIMLDRLCGGPGLPVQGVQQLTEIERSLLRPLGRYVTHALAEAWGPIVQIEPVVEDVLLNPRAARAVTPNDIVALMTFDLAVGDIAGQMSVCLPHRSLEPVMDQLNSRVWSLDAAVADVNPSEPSLRRRLLDVPLAATVILGEVELPTSAIVALREGDVLTLNTAAEAELPLHVEGLPIVRCRPGQNAGHVAVQVVRIVPPVSLET